MKTIFKYQAYLLILFCLFSVQGHANQVQIINGLTVLVSFAEETKPEHAGLPITDRIITATQALDIERLLHEPGYSEHNNVGSLRDYYLDNSGGQLDLNSVVLRVNVDRPRSDFHDGGDSMGPDQALNPHTGSSADVLSLKAGPLFELKEYVLCAIAGNNRANDCSNIPLEYSEFDPNNGQFQQKVGQAFDFSRLSTTESILNVDWLDIRVLLSPSGSLQLFPTVIPHYSFFQMIVPGGRGNEPGEGLWPRVIPSTSTNIDGLMQGGDRFALGRVQVVPLGATPIPGETDYDPDQAHSNKPSIGIIAHETGHALFDFKDLYDTQKLMYFVGNQGPFTITHKSFDLGCEGNSTCEAMQTQLGADAWYESHGVADYSLMGGVNDGHRNPPLINAHNRELAGWEQPMDLIDTAEGEVFTLDWHADGSDPRVARAFKYCKPHSNLNECFYIEARATNWHRDGAQGSRPIYSPSEGLMIWHAEHYQNPLDFEVNQWKQGEDGLHFAVSLVQADGLRQLEDSKDNQITHPGILFDPVVHNQFSDHTPANSRWRDGTPSGLAIRNIQYGPGETMTFEMGERPVRPVFFDFEPSRFGIEINGIPVTGEHSVDIPVGEFEFKVTPLNGGSYDVISGSTEETSRHSGTKVVTAKATYQPNIIQIHDIFALFDSKTISMDLQLDEGVLVHYPDNYYAHWLVDTYHRQQSVGNLLKVGNERTVTFYRLSSGNAQYFLFAQAKPGFQLIEWQVDYQDGQPEVGTAQRIRIDQAKFDATGLPLKIRVRAERIPGLLCAAGAVADWRWDGVYKDIGTKVRHDHAIYSANLPRAHIPFNRVPFADAVAAYKDNNSDLSYLSTFLNNLYSPEDFPQIWSKVEMCGAPTENCNDVPEWVYGHDSYNVNGNDVVQHNGKKWTAVANSRKFDSTQGEVLIPIKDRIPGAQAKHGLQYMQTIETETASNYPLGIASIYNSHVIQLGPMWLLNGNCM